MDQCLYEDHSHYGKEAQLKVVRPWRINLKQNPKRINNLSIIGYGLFSCLILNKRI